MFDLELVIPTWKLPSDHPINNTDQQHHELFKMASKSSAAAEVPPIAVLVALHHNFELLDLAGPLQALQSAQHEANDECKLPTGYPTSNRDYLGSK